MTDLIKLWPRSPRTRQHAAPDSEALLATRAESYRLHVEVRSSLFRLRLVALVPQAQQLAEQAAEIQVKTREIFFAADRDGMPARGEVAEHAGEAFAVRAKEVPAAGE
ncbi:hypothetical protein AB4039_16725 [Streptomyces sp. M-16]|uniref:hypothetical protein n=1 Tax=Streptomyces sp. M-16 TaxID=3233040 RepID=UPI002256FCA0